VNATPPAYTLSNAFIQSKPECSTTKDDFVEAPTAPMPIGGTAQYSKISLKWLQRRTVWYLPFCSLPEHQREGRSSCAQQETGIGICYKKGRW